MKQRVQAMGLLALTQWHRLHVMLYRWTGNSHLAKGMPPRGSRDEAALLALCRKANRHICRAMLCTCRREELLHD